MKIEIFSSRGLWGKRWYFRVRAANGEIIASSEGYRNRGDCFDTAMLLRGGLFNADLRNL